MDKLYIIGNGFDLAHGLKTKYLHFFESLVAEVQSNKSDLAFSTSRAGLKDFLHLRDHHNFKNDFFKILTHKFAEQNWCDIESLYFNEMSSLANFADIKDLNTQFNTIKNKLENYLTNIEKSKVKHNYFKRLISHKSGKRMAVLNFNYTNTVEKYLPIQCDIFHIHGQLNSIENPIIFGYAATENQIEKLREKDNEYMRNVKRTNYNFTSHYRNLMKFIKTPDRGARRSGLKVIIMGHSCNSSDQLILSEIFNHKKVTDIEIVYFNKEDYFQKFTNIQKLIKNQNEYNKIIVYSNSIRMPQFDDGNEYEILLSDYFD